MKIKQRDIQSTNEIKIFFHCQLCVKEKPHDVSPKEYARLEAGFTKLGFQVWCIRHNCNVLHVDFEGQQHPANTSRRKDEKNAA